MAKPIRSTGKVTMEDEAVKKSFTWLLKEIKGVIEEMSDENVRLLAIKYELKRVLKLYKKVR